MLSVERVKELLNDPTLSDGEVEQIRDECRILAEIIFEKWKEDQKKTREQKEKKTEAPASPDGVV